MAKSTKTLYFLLASCLIALGSASTALAEADKKEKEEETKTSVEVLSVATGDWNEDERIDSAVLLKNDGQVELYLYLGNKDGKQEQELFKKDVVWSGEMEGTRPYLEPKKKSSSLFIHSENDAIGRNRWHKRLTVAYRDKTFRVVGYTYDDRDTIEPDSSSSCDVNLATGKGIRNKKEFTLKPQKISLEDWTEESEPEQCNESGGR